ncbi:NAD-P-binding protein [Lactarius hatsudake]|nr:NAD-P-binding protein [Lactarius hatsudake]
MDPIQSIVGCGEKRPVTNHHDVYSTIDPKEAFANLTYRGKVVLITGASRGIGQETAITYAMAGANVTIAGLSQETLDKTAAAIHAAASGAQVLVVPVDVGDPKATEAAVQATLERFGRLDVLIPDAGALSNFDQSGREAHRRVRANFATAQLGDKDPGRWWNTFEVNVRGVYAWVYDTVRASLPALEKTSGRIMVISSSGAQLRVPYASDYTTSKQPINRLVEFIALECRWLKKRALDSLHFDPPQLPVVTVLYFTFNSARVDWLNGKYLAATWDIAEIERD